MKTEQVAKSAPKPGAWGRNPAKWYDALLDPSDEKAFWAFARSYPHKAGTYFTLYRAHPIIVRPKRKHHILRAIYPDVLDREQIEAKCGTGVYHVWFSDKKQPASASMPVALKMKVERPDLAPNLDPAELDWKHPDNQSYVLQLRQSGVYPSGEEPKGEQMENPQGVTELAKQAMDAALSKKSDGESAAALRAAGEIYQQANARIEGLIERLIDERGKKPEGESVLVVLLKGMQSELSAERQRNHDLMREMIGQRTTAATPADPLADLDRVLDIAEKIQSRGGGGSESVGGVVVNGLGKLFDGLKPLLAVMAARAMAGASGEPTSRPSIPAAEAPKPEPAQVGIPEDVMNMLKLAGLDAEVVQKLVGVGKDALEKYQRGVEANDYAHSLVSGVLMPEGPALYETLREMGPDMIMQFVAVLKVPADPDKLKQWVIEFLKYGDDEEEASK